VTVALLIAAIAFEVIVIASWLNWLLARHQR
jgi:hypothetical protein